METISELKAGWPPGPWHEEPDRVESEHAGFPCLARRNHHGFWCGYVAVPPGHPAHGKPFDDLDVDVHGGLTYGRGCEGDICHVAKPGEPDDVWWLGFDCGHAWDLVPGMIRFEEEFMLRHGYGRPRDIYRNLEYVQCQIRSLAEQLREMS